MKANPQKRRLSLLPRLLIPVAALLLFATMFVGCDLDPSNPNNPTEEDAFGTRDGLINSSVGLQRFYNLGTMANRVISPGVTSRELAINTTFSNLVALEEGGCSVDNTNANANGLFTNQTRTIEFSLNLEEGANTVETVEPDLRSGIVALAQFYRAAAIGSMAQNFTHVVLATGQDATFVDRANAFAEAVSLLDAAEQTLNDTPPGDVFQGTMPAEFDLLNTIRAYRARFALFGGDHQGAIDAANSLDAGATSIFVYTENDENPIYETFAPDPLGGSFAARDDLGLESIETGDQRIEFYTTPADVASIPNELSIDALAGFWDDGPSEIIPAYLPGELNLIRAEAYVRLGQLDNAVTEIDAVRTKTPAEDPFGVGANLSAYSGPMTEQALLDEIFYQRSAELYLQGMRLEDARRLSQPGPSSDVFQRNLDFYPFPQQERINNPDTPTDPSCGLS